MQNAIVSIIVPVYNRQNKIKRTLESIRKQELTDFECVIVDDGSTDESAAVIREFIADDDRFTYVWQENSGVASARNNGVFNHSSAPYVMCLDSDDQVEPGYISGLLPYLQADRRLGIVYTKLVLVYDDGRRIESAWPHEFQAKEMFEERNLIPTSALTTRELWNALGGQRSRFEGPGGAGAEDGDFWLRAVSRGFGALFVPLSSGSHFLYNGEGGLVHGNKEYTPPDYYAWSPWAKSTGKMPAPSIYPPAMLSHPVKWYDAPPVTVIIAVGPGHVYSLENALDSLDAQTFQDFQIVVVFDVGKDEWLEASQRGRLRYISNTWPGCWFTSTRAGGKRAREYTSKLQADLDGVSVLDGLPAGRPAGPGKARNVGLSITKTPLVFFLDADDWIVPDTLDKMYAEHIRTGKAIFSDHIGVANVDTEKVSEIDGKVVAVNERTGEAYIHQTISDYRCELAMKQPVLDGRPPYVICNVSTLMRRRDVESVGRFDETIASWEDVLLFWKMAWAGVCFHRIPEPLLVYRYSTGTMRDRGLEQAAHLLKYIKRISDRTEKAMGCGCNDKKPLVQQKTEATAMGTTRLRLSRGAHIDVSDTDLVLVELNPRQNGDMQRFGMNDFGGGNRMAYGPKRQGDRFLAHIKDVQAEETLAANQGRPPEFLRVSATSSKIVEEPEPEAPPAPEPLEVDIWGDDGQEEEVESLFPEPTPGGRGLNIRDLNIDIKNPERAIALLYEQDIETVGALLDYESENEAAGGLAKIEGIGPKIRSALLSAAEEAVE